MTASGENTSDDAGGAGGWFIAAAGSAIVAALMSGFICAGMLSARATMRESDPWTSPELASIRLEIARNADDESIVEDFRRREADLRGRYFQAKRLLTTGVFLLAGSLAVLLVSLKFALSLRNSLPSVRPGVDVRKEDARNSLLGQAAVAGLVGLLSAVVMVIVFTSDAPPELVTTSRKPWGKSPATKLTTPPVKPPTAEQIARNWPRFRGPGGSGVSAYTNIPTAWDGPTNKGILWKTPIALEGKSSPILWGGRLFLTGADSSTREVFCVDAETGKVLWHKAVIVGGDPVGVPKKTEHTGFAAPSPVTDGNRVFASFANGDVACFDFQGAQLWAKNLGLPDNIYGYANSLAMWRDRLIVLFDQGQADDDKSRLLALAGDTGNQVWSTPRKVANSWASPIVINAAGRAQIITCADPWVISYDPADGKEIWRVNCLVGDIGPSPIYAGGMVFAVNEGAVLAAIRPDGKGDVTKSHMVWRGWDGLPDTTSPVSDGKLIWLLTTAGDLTCYDVKDTGEVVDGIVEGKIVYEEELKKQFAASPGIVGDKLYLLSNTGEMLIVSAGRQYKLLATASLGERVFASPVFADGRIYIRGEFNLYYIGSERLPVSSPAAMTVDKP